MTQSRDLISIHVCAKRCTSGMDGIRCAKEHHGVPEDFEGHGQLQRHWFRVLDRCCAFHSAAYFPRQGRT